METQKFDLIPPPQKNKKINAYLSVPAVMFCKQFLSYVVYIDWSAFLCNPKGSGGRILGLGEVQRSSLGIVKLSCPGRPSFSSSYVFWFFLGCLSFHQPPGLLSFLSLFLRPCMIHVRMPGRSRAFVHGHTSLHSWSGPMT